jgi:hypothetical protein
LKLYFFLNFKPKSSPHQPNETTLKAPTNLKYDSTSKKYQNKIASKYYFVVVCLWFLLGVKYALF